MKVEGTDTKTAIILLYFILYAI